MTPAEKQEEEFDRIIKGLEKVRENLIEYKKQKNSPLVVMKEGKIVKIKPEELED